MTVAEWAIAAIPAIGGLACALLSMWLRARGLRRQRARRACLMIGNLRGLPSAVRDKRRVHEVILRKEVGS